MKAAVFILLISSPCLAAPPVGVPKLKKGCSRITYSEKCSEIAHYRDHDYIPFRWEDEATDCSIDDQIKSSPPICTYVSRMRRVMYREGCFIVWCKK